jgi:Fur family ferric uptake transcriptional regulator
VVDNQLVKYALDNSVTHKKDHAHFYCNSCDSVLCLESVAVKQPILPNGYTSEETEVIIKGTCAMCGKKEDQF